MSPSLAIIALEYLEPDYVQTLKCLHDTCYPVFFAKRDGVGNMSRAFNETFDREVRGRFDQVWFVTNVVFEPTVPSILSQVLEFHELAGVHPACSTSDHLHLRPNGTTMITEVPFLEFMAPMFCTKAFGDVMLEEDLWYWYMDLVISHELKKQDHRLGCAHGVEVAHTYLRNREGDPFTKIRKQMRELLRNKGQVFLRQKYGKDWRKVLEWQE